MSFKPVTCSAPDTDLMTESLRKEIERSLRTLTLGRRMSCDCTLA